jgi:hypothetical protein
MHKPLIFHLRGALRYGQVQTACLGLLFVVLSACGFEAQGIQGFEKFRKFDRIFEPSGVQQLPDSRFLVVEDEAAHPLDLFSLDSDGEVSETHLSRGSLFSWRSSNRAMNALDDLEALAVDGQGRIYAITSHSRKENGKRRDNREQLVRFSIREEQVIDLKIQRGLRKAITREHKSLKGATKIRDVKEDEGFNIEGLSFDAANQQLLIGLRAPTPGDDAIIVILENPQAVFDNHEKPRIAEQLIRLDLDGGGIRSLSYDPHLKGYLIISRKPEKAFKLWLWNGDTDASPRRIKIPGIKNLRQAEGVTPVRIGGQAEGILIVSDEGEGLKGKPGRYLFLKYEQLDIE